MANTCKINNSLKLKPKDVLSLIEKELISKFKFYVTAEYNKEHESFCFNINGINFVFFKTGEGFEFYDCPDTALSRHNDVDDNEYVTVGLNNAQYYAGVSCGFCYIYEYIKNFLAEKVYSAIDSDGIGIYTPFENRYKYNDFNSWLNYCEDQISRNSKVRYLLTKVMFPSLKKIKSTEKKYFPELFIK